MKLPSHQEVFMNRRNIGCFLMIFLIACGIVSAQGFSGDARRIAMGGIGNVDNLAAKMIEDEREYSSIIIPFGLFQLIADRDRFNPNNKAKFDPILGMEYAASPLYLVIGRDPGGARGQFVSNIINGKFTDIDNFRDLNTYRGFVPTNHLLSEGLANPSWGKSFKLRKAQDGSFQSFYVGVGPYLSVRNELNIDPGLTNILTSPTPVVLSTIANKQYLITDSTTGQLALDVTFGYRGRFALPGGKDAGKSKRDGIYVGMNYHYLHGFAYQNPDITVRFDTGSDGKITLNPLFTNPSDSPVVLNYRQSHSGSGLALDFGIGVVTDSWEFGFGANGAGNRINWDGQTFKQFTMASLSNGGNLINQRMPISDTVTVNLPVDYTWNVGYNLKTWSAAVEVSHGFQGSTFHGGVEYRLLSTFEFRGGLRYGLDRWTPSGGVGLNLGKRFSIDYALFGSTTNIERDLKPAMALSLRLNHLQKT
jgi:hypothetical protein